MRTMMSMMVVVMRMMKGSGRFERKEERNFTIIRNIGR